MAGFYGEAGIIIRQSTASLYETFPPAEVRRMLRRVEFHYTPKRGSWLNMAEIEIAILQRNALS